MSFSKCMSIVTNMAQADQDALLTKLDEFQAAGLSPQTAQRAAVEAMLKQMEDEASAPVQRSERDQTEAPAFKRWFGDWEASSRQKVNLETIERALTDKQWQQRTLIAQGIDADPSGKLSQAFGFSINKQHITPDDIRKTDKKHGAGNEAYPDQIGLTHDDYVKMIEVLRDPQTYRITTSKNGKPSAEFGYKFSDGTYVVAEVEVSEDGAVSFKTAWKKITGRNHAGATAYPVRTTSDNAASDAILHSDSLIVKPDSVSKVVDVDGKPLVVYHGTDRQINVFDNGFAGKNVNHPATRAGFFFTEDKTAANNYAVGADIKSYNAGDESGVQQVMSVYLSIKSPIELHVESADEGDNLLEKADLSGYDGAIIRIKSKSGASANYYVAFSPTQIKSATGDNRNFDGANPDISKSERDPYANEKDVGLGIVSRKVTPGTSENGRVALSTREEIMAGADAIKAMDEDTRDNLEPAKAPGGWHAYVLYEARKLLPKPSDKLKKLNDRNTFIGHQDQDYFANVDGTYYGVNKWEDPDATGDEEEGTEPFVYAFSDLTNPIGSTINSMESGVPELMAAIRASQVQRSTRDGRVMLEDVFVASPIGAASNHPDYEAAKAGDSGAAMRLTKDLVTPELVSHVKNIANGRPLTLVPVLAQEASGRNKIPLGAAIILEQATGASVDLGLVQNNSPKRTAMDGMARIFNSPTFDGPVTPGTRYLLLDDTLTQGATFASLESHIRNGGGVVVGAVALTGKQYSAKIKLSNDTLKHLIAKHGDIEPAFRAITGYGYASLTESEARYIASFKPADAIRDRILTERDANVGRSNAQDAGLTSESTPDILRSERDQTNTQEFKRWSNDAPLVTSEDAGSYPFKSGAKVVLEAYHGTGRGDRVGEVFKRSRATSGPMAYFTSSAGLASKYAIGKEDTSRSLEDNPYESWFKFKPKGQRTPVDIARAWHGLDNETQARVAERLPDIRTNDDGEVIYEAGGGDIGSYNWNLKQTQKGYDKRGNPLAAAVETWLNSGALYGDEQGFMKVLKLAGMPVADIEFDSPNETFPFVYKTFIKMGNPLVTSDVPADVVNALRAAAKTDRSRAKFNSGVDSWDKNTKTLKEWVEAFNEKDNQYVWTSIPDKVTEVFKSLGYDGIIDWSGKSGGFAHPVYIPFSETQVKSAIGNNGKFDGSKTNIMKSERAPAELFFSELARQIKTASMKQAPAAEWKKFIGALGQKGVKADEIEWSGVNDWLDLQTGKVPKEALLAYLDANGVQVQETALGKTLLKTPEEAIAFIAYAEGMTEEEVRENWGYTNERDYITLASSLVEDDGNEASSTKYSQYTMPGGENYREVLLTLPDDKKRNSRKQVMDKYEPAIQAAYAEISAAKGRDWDLAHEKLAGIRAERDKEANEVATKSELAGYTSAHWDQPNVLAHLRLNDRTDAEGGKVLFVEEIQSDWGQDGKKKGFGNKAKLDHIKEWTELDRIDRRTGGLTPEQRARLEELDATPEPAQGVPNAPFVTKTDAWLSLAIKRVMGLAVDGGYDKVAFVTGAQSAERYDLSKQIEAVDIGRTKSGAWEVFAKPIGGGSPINRQVATIEEVADIVGKDLAEKAKDTQPNENHKYTGLDLKVGGEGMTTFYDKIVPNATNALLKKLGGGKMEDINLVREMSEAKIKAINQAYATGTAADIAWANGLKGSESNQPGFTITPAMREKVAGGMPLFSARDQTETPAFKKWFGDSKVVDAQGRPLVVYHGTDAPEFTVFRNNQYSHWFAENNKLAERYKGRGHGGFPRLVATFLSIRNPLVISADANTAASPESFARIMKELSSLRTEKNVNDNQQFTKILDDIGYAKTIPKDASIHHIVHSEEFMRLAYAAGYDGINIKEWGDSTWAVANPAQIKSATYNNGNFDGSDGNISHSVRSGTSTWDMDAKSSWDDFVFKMQNKQIDMKRVVESIGRYVGQVADDLNVYLQEELFHGRAAKRTSDFAQQELQPLMKAIKAAGYQLADVEEYLHARHAIEANRVIANRNPNDPNLQDGGSGMTNAAATTYLQSLSQAELAKMTSIAAKVDAILAETKRLYVDYSLESQQTVAGWTQMFQHYIPLQREEKEGSGSMGIGQGFSIKGKETRGRTGSKRKVVDILANIAMQRERLIVRGEKNRVSAALVGLAQANPNPEFWDVGAPPSTRVYDPKTNTVVNRVDPMYKSRDNVVVAKVKDANGLVNEVAVVFNEEDARALRMAAALKNLDAGQLEGLWGASAKITRYFAAVNTQWNPVFGVVNLVRDVQGAMVNLGGTPLANQKRRIAVDTLSALKGIYADIRAERNGLQGTSPWSQLFEEFQKEGGQTGFRDMFATSADRAKELEKTLNPGAWADSKIGKMFTLGGRLKTPMTKAVGGAGAVFDWLSDYNSAMENGVRLAAYKAGLDQGMTRQKAASLAKNLTVNFNRKGDIGMQAGAVWAFFNAAMQGSARIGQTLFDMEPGKIKTLKLSGTGKKVVYGGMMLGSLQAFMLLAAGFGDDDPPEFLRERSFIIPTGGKSYISIPMPLGLHVIPGIGRHMTEFALSGFAKPAQRAVSVISMFADAFNPIGNAGLSMQTLAPTAFDPFVALSENRDWTGKPIARTSSNKAIPGHSQWKDTATGAAKGLAEMINWASGGNEYVAGALSPTPDQIEYLVAQVTGGVGRELMKVEQAARSLLTGEELPTFKVPLAGRFFGNTASQSSQAGSFYANSDRLNALETEVKGLRKDGKAQEAATLLRAHPEAAMMARVNVAERQIQRLRKEKRELIKAGAERPLIKLKETQITDAMTRVNAAMEKFKD